MSCDFNKYRQAISRSHCPRHQRYNYTRSRRERYNNFPDTGKAGCTATTPYNCFQLSTLLFDVRRFVKGKTFLNLNRLLGTRFSLEKKNVPWFARPLSSAIIPPCVTILNQQVLAEFLITIQWLWTRWYLIFSASNEEIAECEKKGLFDLWDDEICHEIVIFTQKCRFGFQRLLRQSISRVLRSVSVVRSASSVSNIDFNANVIVAGYTSSCIPMESISLQDLHELYASISSALRKFLDIKRCIEIQLVEISIFVAGSPSK